MKHVVLIGFILAGCGFSLLRGGSVLPLADTPEVTGKLTLGATSIHVEGSSTSDINLSDILEADFSDTPFLLNFYYGSTDKGGQLPPNWQGQDIGTVGAAGSVADDTGTFSVSGSGNSEKPGRGRTGDSGYFVGRQWTGNGEWTSRVDKVHEGVWETGAGIMFRDTLDPTSMMFSVGAGTAGNGGYAFRAEAGRPLQGTAIPMDLPLWMRLTRYANSVFASISTDGKDWDLIGGNNFKDLSATPWIGLYVDSRRDKALGKAIFDQISFTPSPSSAQILPPGVLLQSGSFLAGTFEHLATDPTNPDLEGIFRRNGTMIKIPRSKIAAVIMLPTTRSQLADMTSHVGLLMKNGDVMDGDFDSINGSSVLINSVLLGITTYDRAQVRGCFLHPVKVLPATYQFRLHDGSIVDGTSLIVNNADLAIQESSGINVDIADGEMAQLRAGPSVVQSLAELDWKATTPTIVPSATPPAPAAAPATNSTAANAAPVANPVPGEPLPAVQSWAGPNQEQVMEAGMGTTIEFPLPGKFRAMGVRIALSPDSPPNSQITIRVLADGREVGRTPPFKAGDPPRFMEITLQDPRTVTLEANSIFSGTKVLFIDPIAIRDN